MLVRPHLSIASARRTRRTWPDASLLADVVTPKVLEALRLSTEALTRAGVRHVVVGGLAVCVHGSPRNTALVEFLLGSENFHQHPSSLVTLRAEVPFQVNGVAIDLLSPAADEPFLEAALAAPPGSFLEAPTLVYLKLKSPRRKDEVDVIELVKAGIDVRACRAWLATHAPDFVGRFDACVAQAESERE